MPTNIPTRLDPPSYVDPHGATIPFDPVTLTPLYDANVSPLHTPSGAPINFYIPPPPPSPTPAPAASNLVYYIGGGTIVALIVIYFVVRER